MATPGVPGVKGNNAGRRGVSHTSGEALRDFDRECPWQMEGGYMEDPVLCGQSKDPDEMYCPDHQAVREAQEEEPVIGPENF